MCLSGFFLATVATAKNEAESAEKILKKVSDKLSKSKTLNYTYQVEYNYASENYQSKQQCESYLDFTSTDKIIGTTFQFDTSNALIIYNGSELFKLNKKSKMIALENNPIYDNIKRISCFQDSPLTLKNALPTIISDNTITKIVTEKSINNKNFYVVEFSLDNKFLDLTGNYSPTTIQRKFTYQLTIDKSNFLPTEILRSWNDKKDFTRTNFQYKETTVSPKENSWYYSTYLNEYKPATPKENRLIKIGQDAPEWKLASLKDDTSVSLNQYKNKVVLIEFWESFCGYCIAAVPKLNVLEEKYKNKNFKLVAINDGDSKEIIQKFKMKSQPKFQIL